MEVKTNDVAGYRKLYNLLLKCQIVVSICRETNLDSRKAICMLISILPDDVRECWNNKREPRLFDLLSFVEGESFLVNEELNLL